VNPNASISKVSQRIRLPEKGDILPGTHWRFESFGMAEGASGSGGAAFIPNEFGTNSRYIGWSLNVNVPKNSAGSLTISCSYLDGLGRPHGDPMNVRTDLTNKDNGTHWFSDNLGNSGGTYWTPGTYRVVCQADGTTLVDISFRVVPKSVYFMLNEKGVHNPLLLIATSVV
jgi:hypothetical protein